MKIGIVTTWFDRGAAYVSKQFKELFEKEHSVFIYARGGEKRGKGDQNWDGPSVHWAKRFYRDSTEIDLREFRNWINKHNIDMVLFNEQRWWDVLAYCNEKGITAGAYIDYYTEESLPLFGLYDFLICNTRRHFEAFNWHPNAWYIPWGTDTNTFHLQENKHSIESNRIVFFHSAGMAPQRKGTESTLKAFLLMKSKQAKMVIHTQKKLEKVFPELTETIQSLQEEGRLAIIHETVPAPGLYHLGDVYVYPSHLEGIGLTMAEALSCGLPLITVDVPPMNEFVDPSFSIAVKPKRIYARKDGYYWPKNDVDIEALAKAMDSFCDGSIDMAKLKFAARDYALQNLDWEKNASILMSKIEDVNPIDQTIKQNALKILREYKETYKKSMKTFFRDYFPGIYAFIRHTIKGRL